MSFLISLIGQLGWRNVLLVLSLGTLGFLGWQKFIKKKTPPKQVLSLLQEMEYVNELRLVTYYSEELLEIGVQSALGREVIKQETQVEESRRDSVRYYSELTHAQANLVYFRGQLDSIEQQILLETNRISQAENQEKDLKPKWNKVKRLLNRDTLAYGSQVARMYSDYRALERRHDKAKRKEKKELKKQMDVLEDRLLTQVAILQKKAQSAIEASEAKLDALEKSKKALSKTLKRQERQINNLAKDFTEATVAYRQAQAALALLRIEDSLLSDAPPPNLVAVVLTGVTAYVDLRNMQPIVTEDTLRFEGVQPAIVDCQIELNLDPEKRFALDDTDKLTNEQAKTGAYFKIFQEMRKALEDTKYEVIQRAINNGIRQEADSLARDYLEQMGRCMSFPYVEIELAEGAFPITSCTDTDSLYFDPNVLRRGAITPTPTDSSSTPGGDSI